MRTFHLRVVAHDKVFYDGQAGSITLPAYDGEIQILYDHENYIFAVVPGGLKIRNEQGEVIRAVCGSGFAEVFTDTEVEVLVDTIEKPEEIDVRRAREAKERAEEQLRQHQSQLEYHRSTTSLARAMARLKEASKFNKTI